MKNSARPVVFYRARAGAEPVLEWLREFGKDDRRQLGHDLLRVQENWPIGMPLCKSLGAGLWEVRSSLPGNRIVRILFCIHGGSVLVLHGFVKKTAKAPKQELDIARSRLKEMIS